MVCIFYLELYAITDSGHHKNYRLAGNPIHLSPDRWSVAVDNSRSKMYWRNRNKDSGGRYSSELDIWWIRNIKDLTASA